MTRLQGLSVLVVGINYRPETTGIAPYTTLLSEHLVRQGAQVQVLAGVPHYPEWIVPEPYVRRLRSDELRAGVRVRRLRHYVPRTQSFVRRGMYELTFAGHVSVQRLSRPDVVLAVVPSLLAALVAQSRARRWKVPCVVWVQDLMGYAVAQSGMGGRLSSRLTQAAETSLVRRADTVVTIHDKFAQHMRDSGVDIDRAVLIRNWAHTDTTIASKNTARRTFGWPQDDVVALHTGNMGLKQDLGNVVTAARLAQDASKDIRFVLVGDGSQRSHLESISGGIENLTMLPPVHEGMYPELLAAADVLLVNERPSSVDMSLPSKLTSYCLAGQPIVAAVPSNGATAREVRSSGAGIVIPPGDPAGLLSAVERVAGDPGLRETLSAAGVRYATDHLDADRAMDAFSELIDRLVQLRRI